MGSGFIIDKSGDIVTNNHVVEDGKKITVKLPDGHEYDAKLVGADKATDIAVLKIYGDRPLPSVEFGDDRQVRVGDWVIAVGNPFGLSNTVTAGIISSIGRDVGNGPYTDFLQIDASINRGNSGGPTFDLQGKVIGMNTMIFSPSGRQRRHRLRHSVIDSSRDRGSAEERMVMCRAAGCTASRSRTSRPILPATVGTKITKGAIVSSTAVVPGGPCSKGRILRQGRCRPRRERQIGRRQSRSRRVAWHCLPGSRFGRSDFHRRAHDGPAAQRQRHHRIAQGEDGQVASVAPAQSSGNAGRNRRGHGFGSCSAVTPEMRREFSLDNNVNGVVVTRVDPNSDAADKGIEAGDVVVSVANQSVRTPKRRGEEGACRRGTIAGPQDRASCSWPARMVNVSSH